jgi:hypothetical protein
VLGWALIGTGLLAGAALGRKAILTRRARACAEVLDALSGVHARVEGTRVFAEHRTASGTTQIEIAARARGAVWRFVRSLPWLNAGPFATLWPKTHVIDELVKMAELDLGDPKPSLPALMGGESTRQLRQLWLDAVPDIRRGTSPIVSRAEGAWIVRLMLHPAIDFALMEQVLAELATMTLSSAAERDGLSSFLGWVKDGAHSAEEIRTGISASFVARDALVALDRAGERLLRCELGDGGVEAKVLLDSFPDGERAERLLDATAGLVDALGGPRGAAPQGDLRCPVDASALRAHGAAGEHECPTCSGRLLERDAVRQFVLDPLGKSPGDLKQAADGAQGADVLCAVCSQPTSPVFLEDVIVDLCTSCGAMWLDEGELSALSLGRFEG